MVKLSRVSVRLLAAAVFVASAAVAITARTVAAFASGHSGPRTTSVTVTFPAGGSVITTPVVWRGGKAWFAVDDNGDLMLYRWDRDHWQLDGAVKLPAGMPGSSIPGQIAVASITRGSAPDFTSHFVGADTWWFALVARIHGHWQVVPFDDQFASRDPYTFAYGATHGLIEAVFDACGCAGGPTTFQWYRFGGDGFVPTSPPGAASPCTRAALDSADHSFQIPGDPLTSRVTRDFAVNRFACADGWALATNGVRVGIYEQNGSSPLREYKSGGGRWLRVGVGMPRLAGTEVDFAMPHSLLTALGRRIGVQFPASPRQQRPWPADKLNPWARAPIAASFKPGDFHQESVDLYEPRPKLLRIPIETNNGTTVLRFRWRDGKWVRIQGLSPRS